MDHNQNPADTGRTGAAAPEKPEGQTEKSRGGTAPHTAAVGPFHNAQDDDTTHPDGLSIAYVRHKAAPVSAREVLTWPALVAKLGTPMVGAKDGPGWLPAAILPGTRTGARVTAVSALVLDIEAKTTEDKDTGIKTAIGPEPPPPADVAAEVDLWHWCGCIHTSHSHRDPAILPADREHPRYRLVLRLSHDIAPNDVRPLGLHVLALLGLTECADLGCLEPARLFYLPRCPAERLPLFETYAMDGSPLDVDSLLADARREAAARQVVRPKSAGRTGSVIEAFNAAHDVAALLEGHGYLPRGRGRWLHPESTTKAPGVRTLPGTEPRRVFSSHGCDPLNDGHAHDAFDVWRILDHGGDNAAAIKDAARLLGMDRPADEAPKGERGERGETPRQHSRGEGANAGRTGAKRPDADGGNTRAAMMDAARRALKVGTPAVPDYPLAALGPLADVARAIADGAQLRVEMAGQSVLAVAALLGQSRANVRSLDAVKPLSLNLLTIADSGDGKTTADSAAQCAVQERQRADARTYAAALDEHEGAPKKDRGPVPREPYRVARDGTVEGIRRGFAQGLPSQAVFSSEAAAMLAGYGMAPEHRAKTAATLNALWDDGEISVSRSLAGRIQLYDRRLSIHWLIQPSAVEDVLADPALSSMGFWPRFLVCWPDASPPRAARRWDAARDPAIGEFWRRCTEMMDAPLGDDCADLRTLHMGSEAEGILGAFFERMDRAAKGGALSDIKPFAVRATEHAARIAGVLAEFGGRREVDVAHVRGGIALAGYSLDTWHGIFGDRDRATAVGRALRLFAWMLDQSGWSASETAMLRIGPKPLRSRDRRDTALAVLEQHGLVRRDGSTWSVEVPS